MIASKSWQIHKLQSNVPDCPTIGIRPRSVRSQNAIPQNTGNAGTIFCNPGDPGGTGCNCTLVEKLHWDFHGILDCNGIVRIAKILGVNCVYRCEEARSSVVFLGMDQVWGLDPQY